MSAFLPWLFLALAFLCLLWAAYAFWVSITGLLGGGLLQAGFFHAGPIGEQAEHKSAQYLTLLEQKAHILRSLKELEEDHLEGKISDDDFNALNQSMREQAKKILTQIDAQLEPGRQKAEQMIEQTLKQVRSTEPSHIEHTSHQSEMTNQEEETAS